MRTYIQKGDRITIPAPADVQSDAPVSVRSIFGFAHADALAGEDLVVIVEGVFERTVQAAADVSHGDELFFDEAAGEITTDSNADANRPVGYAVADAASDGTTATVKVKLV